MKHFNQTYIDTSKVDLDFAKAQGDESLPRAWSKHTIGSSAYQLTHKKEEKKDWNKREEKMSNKEVEEKKRKFRDFLNVMGVKSGDNKQSWNDSF